MKDMSRRIENPVMRWYLPSWRDILPTPFHNQWWTLSDIDGFGERNGRFLFVEHKSPGVKLDLEGGQGRALEALSKLPKVCVLAVWGALPKGRLVAYQRVGFDPEPVDCSEDEGRWNRAEQVFIHWYRWADGEVDGHPWEEE